KSQAADRCHVRTEEAHVLSSTERMRASMETKAGTTIATVSAPASARPTAGAAAAAAPTMRLQIYRYDPDRDERPRMQAYQVRLQPTDRMLLDALLRIKAEIDDSLAFRRSC